VPTCSLDTLVVPFDRHAAPKCSSGHVLRGPPAQSDARIGDPSASRRAHVSVRGPPTSVGSSLRGPPTSVGSSFFRWDHLPTSVGSSLDLLPTSVGSSSFPVGSSISVRGPPTSVGSSGGIFQAGKLHRSCVRLRCSEAPGLGRQVVPDPVELSAKDHNVARGIETRVTRRVLKSGVRSRRSGVLGPRVFG